MQRRERGAGLDLGRRLQIQRETRLHVLQWRGHGDSREQRWRQRCACSAHLEEPRWHVRQVSGARALAGVEQVAVCSTHLRGGRRTIRHGEGCRWLVQRESLGPSARTQAFQNGNLRGRTLPVHCAAAAASAAVAAAAPARTFMNGRNGPTLVHDIATLSTCGTCMRALCDICSSRRAAAASNPDPAPCPDLNWFWQKVARVEVKLEELAALVQGERATVGGERSVTCNVKRCTS